MTGGIYELQPLFLRIIACGRSVEFDELASYNRKEVNVARIILFEHHGAVRKDIEPARGQFALLI